MSEQQADVTAAKENHDPSPGVQTQTFFFFLVAETIDSRGGQFPSGKSCKAYFTVIILLLPQRYSQPLSE